MDDLQMSGGRADVPGNGPRVSVAILQNLNLYFAWLLDSKADAIYNRLVVELQGNI
jgi:hypothetical protein